MFVDIMTLTYWACATYGVSYKPRSHVRILIYRKWFVGLLPEWFRTLNYYYNNVPHTYIFNTFFNQMGQWITRKLRVLGSPCTCIQTHLVSIETRLVSLETRLGETRRVSRDGSNLLSSGTVSTNLYIIFTFHRLLTWICKPSYIESTCIARNKPELEQEHAL